jgi:hypothetical protein
VCFLLSRAGTRIGQASECFVYWKDPVTNDTWGLNFTSPADARAFRECCVSFPCLLIVVNDHQLGGFEYPALLGGPFQIFRADYIDLPVVQENRLWRWCVMTSFNTLNGISCRVVAPLPSSYFSDWKVCRRGWGESFSFIPLENENAMHTHQEFQWFFFFSFRLLIS